MTKDELMKYDKETLIEILLESAGWIITKKRLREIQFNLKSLRQSQQRLTILERQRNIWDEIKHLDPGGKDFERYAALVIEDLKLSKKFNRLLKDRTYAVGRSE